jgi:release factor glutamine methyltransferase
MDSIPDHERERLRRAVSGRPAAALALDPDLDPEEQRRLDELVRRRAGGEPLQYLEGTVAFGPLELVVDRRALIPRPETEQLWELAVAALGEAGPGTTIVDLGTGCGALALALKAAFPAARVIGIDRDPEALALAAENAARSGLEVEFLQGDLFGPLPASLRGRVDLVVSNPPYVAEAEWTALPADVRDHEPREALVAGPLGTEILARIAAAAVRWLGVGGLVLCEIGETQGRAVEELFWELDAEIRRDLAGRQRFVVGRRREP